MTPDDWESIHAELTNLLDGFSKNLPESQVAEMREELEAGEYGVALETLCAQLYEHYIEPDPLQYSKIETLGKCMGIEARRWVMLRPSASEPREPR